VDSEATERGIELGRNAQIRVADLVVGIMSIKLSDEAPAVRLGLRNLTTGDREQVVFVPGEAQHLLDHTLEVVSINRQPPGSVVLRAAPDEVSA
jgi:hypothetical protein